MSEVSTRHSGVSVVAAGSTHIGRRRQHNEDTILLRPDLHLFLVADGAGGHNAGNVASALTATSMANYFEATDREAHQAPSIDRYGLWTGARRIASAIKKANRDVVEISRTSEKHQGMGSTIVAISASPTEPFVHIAHVGDSRCYRLRNGHLEQLTHDHSLMNDVLELQPDIPDEALARLPRKVVTRALGMEPNVRASVRTFEVLSGDRFLLCSDGLSGEVPDEKIRAELAMDVDPSEIAERLIDQANEAGGNDNIAAVVLACEVAPPSTSRPRPVRGVEAEDPYDPREGSAPEILLLGFESLPDIEAQVRVIPTASASAGLIDALGTFMAQKRGQAKRGTTCAKCNMVLEGMSLFCPQCGAPRTSI